MSLDPREAGMVSAVPKEPDRHNLEQVGSQMDTTVSTESEKRAHAEKERIFWLMFIVGRMMVLLRFNHAK
jgi:hypothetical protein